eukprot:14025472-Alexandrium_andersonii.AAC.1
MDAPPIAGGNKLLQPGERAPEGGPLGPGATAHARLEVNRGVRASLESARNVGGLPEPRIGG